MTNGEWIREKVSDVTNYLFKRKCPPYVQSCKALNCWDCWEKWEGEEHVPREKLPFEQQEGWALRDFYMRVREVLIDKCIDGEKLDLVPPLLKFCTELDETMNCLRKKKFKAEKGEKIDEP